MTPFAEGARMMRPERLHITLDILEDFADYPDDMARGLIAAGARVSAAPCAVALDLVTGGTDTIALRPRLANTDLADLHGAIGAARRAMGIAGRSGYRFSPHMTLVYREGAPFSRAVAPFGWRAGEFVLIHSLIGRTVHDVIGRWPLTGTDSLRDSQPPCSDWGSDLGF